MTAPVLAGTVSGIGMFGLILAGRRLLGSGRPSLESRVAPYIRDVPTRAPLWSPRAPSDSVLTAAAAVLAPSLAQAGIGLQRVVGGGPSTRSRLERAGSDLSLEQFRVSQVVWAGVAFGVTLLFGLLGPALQPGRAFPWLLLCFGIAGLGAMARDNRLTRQVTDRERRILADFPVVADLLALSVAAGEGPVSALERVVSTCGGPLSEELARVLADSRTGTSIGEALDALARRTGLPVVARFAQAIAVSMARGTPLVDVLAAQAGDVRESARRALIEAGARKEVVMMVPVVFLCLPVTLLFAFYPGVVGLNVVAS
jgi:tight adherence protein C